MSFLRIATIVLTTSVLTVALHAQGDKTRIKARMGMEGAGDARSPVIAVVRSGANAVLVQRQEVSDDGVVKGRLDLYDRAKLGFLRTQPPVEKLTNGAKVVPDRVVIFNDRTIMIARAHGAGSTDLHYQILDPNITRLPPPYEPLCSWPMALPAPTTVEPANFNYAYAPDSALLLMHSPMVNAPGGHKAMLGLWSKDMSMRWTNVLPGAEGSLRSTILDAAVDTAGTAFVLVSDRMANSEVLDGKHTSRITLFRINKDSISVAPVKLSREKFLTHAALRQVPGGIVLAGVYGLVKDDRIVIQGDLVARIGVDGQVGDPMLVPHFEANALIAEGEPPPVEGQKFVEKDVERLMTGIRVVDVLPRTDGGFFLVKELYFMETYFDLKTKRQANRYIHGPLQATAVGKGGAAEWNGLFRRWHKSDRPGQGDVIAGVFADELFLFVLDSEEMAALRKSGGKMVPGQMKDPYTAHVGFDAKGLPRVKPILKSGNETGFMSGSAIHRFGPTEYYGVGSEKADGGRTLPVRIDLATETK